MTLQLDSWEHQLLAQAYAPLESLLRHEWHLPANREPYRMAYRYCEEITRQHSRTFYAASSLLPAAQRRAVRALYAFCRVSDDIVDSSDGNRAELLDSWRLTSLSMNPSDTDLVALAWADTRRRFRIPREYAEQLLLGVGRDLEQTRYRSFVELADYCYAVASTVGLMTMHVVGYSGREAIPYAVKLGVALQLTNILRDVGEDWRNGRLYLPADELAAHGLTEEDIHNGQVDDRWRSFMRFQISRARRLYAESLPGVRHLARSGRLAIAAAAELYGAILTDIEKHDYDVFSRRARVTDGQKLSRLPGIWWRSRSGYHEPPFDSASG